MKKKTKKEKEAEQNKRIFLAVMGGLLAFLAIRYFPDTFEENNIETLKKKLDKAVKEEDYETAAILRDRIKVLELNS